ncbi:anti-sigma factor family protein [Salinicola peritrichatus]|uniref:anti-sigma factor family protein n=1 Tax=Salinicola peritrichatus TaxID=1267424 RepID=UPI000DA1663E|nr:anti-sigma factor [Salinicola peritrichatus]
MNERHPSEYDLHAYLDGQLDDERQRWVEAWLATQPERAAEVEAWRRDARRLRAVYANPQQWPHNPALDPAALRRRRHQRQRRHLATAAMLVMALGLGMTGGWQANDMMRPPSPPPMADAVQAYRLFADASPVGLEPETTPANGRDAHAEPAVDTRAHVEQLFHTHFSGGVMPPDLSAAGLRMVDVRLLATEQGPAAMVIYRDRAGRRMMMYIRPPGSGNRLLDPGKRLDGHLMAQYWSEGNYNYAVVSQPDDPNAAMLERMLRSS